MAKKDGYADEQSIVDHTPDDLASEVGRVDPLDKAEAAARLRELRAPGRVLSQAEFTELQRLAAEESEAAGHVVAEPGKEKHPGEAHMTDMLGLVEAIIDTLPALRSLRPQLDAIKNRLELLLNPPDKG